MKFVVPDPKTANLVKIIVEQTDKLEDALGTVPLLHLVANMQYNLGIIAALSMAPKEELKFQEIGENLVAILSTASVYLKAIMKPEEETEDESVNG